MARGLVLVQDAFVSHAIDDRHGSGVSCASGFGVARFNSSYYFLDNGADQ